MYQRGVTHAWKMDDRVILLASPGEKAPSFGYLGGILDLTFPEPIQHCLQFSYLPSILSTNPSSAYAKQSRFLTVLLL